MSDFLSRLVQRTRGEVATVRPVGHAVTAPDPNAAAWDEQVLIREAPLVRRPRAPAAQEMLSSMASRTRAASPPWIQRAAATSSMTIAARDAAVPIPEMAEAAAEVAAEPPSLVHDPAPTTPARPVSDVRTIAPTAALEASPPRPTTAEPPSPARAAHVAIDAMTPPPIEPTATLVEVREIRDPAPSPTIPFAAPVLAPPGIDEAAHAAPAWIAPAASTPGAVQLAPARAEARLAAAPPPLRRASMVGADGDGPVHEHTTTVEVSIGRIEVRLPPQPRATAPSEPLPAPRRAAVSLAEYLRDRDAGKTR